MSQIRLTAAQVENIIKRLSYPENHGVQAEYARKSAVSKPAIQQAILRRGRTPKSAEVLLGLDSMMKGRERSMLRRKAL